MQPKGVGIRFVAVLIDSIVLWILAGIVQSLYGGGFSVTAVNLQGSSALVMFLVFLGYYIAMEAMWGATVGKFAVGIRVRMVDGKPCTWAASVIRNLLRIVDGLFVYLVGAIVVWSSKKKQRVGDMAAKTLVVGK